jgi:hypothetical protein
LIILFLGWGSMDALSFARQFLGSDDGAGAGWLDKFILPGAGDKG